MPIFEKQMTVPEFKTAGSAFGKELIDFGKAYEDRRAADELLNLKKGPEARAADKSARERASREALVKFAKEPLQTAAYLDAQRGDADAALLQKVDKMDRPFTAKEAASIQGLYESATPFYRDVFGGITQELIAKDVDPTTASKYAKEQAALFPTIKSEQSRLDTRAKALNEAAKAQEKYGFNVLDAQTKALKAKDKKQKSYSAKTKSNASTTLGKAIFELGNESEVAKLRDEAKKAGVNMGEFAVRFAEVGGFSPDASFWDVTDWRKRDIDAGPLKELIAEKTAKKAGWAKDGKKMKSFGDLIVPGQAEVQAAKDVRTTTKAEFAKRMDGLLADIDAPAEEAKKPTKVLPPKTKDEGHTDEEIFKELEAEYAEAEKVTKGEVSKQIKPKSPIQMTRSEQKEHFDTLDGYNKKAMIAAVKEDLTKSRGIPGAEADVELRRRGLVTSWYENIMARPDKVEPTSQQFLGSYGTHGRPTKVLPEQGSELNAHQKKAQARAQDMAAYAQKILNDEKDKRSNEEKQKSVRQYVKDKYGF